MCKRFACTANVKKKKKNSHTCQRKMLQRQMYATQWVNEMKKERKNEEKKKQYGVEEPIEQYV